MNVVLMNPEIDLDAAKRRVIAFTHRTPTEADVAGRIEILDVAPGVAFIAVRPSYRAVAVHSTMHRRLESRGGLVWIAYSRTESVWVHDQSEWAFRYRGDDVLTGGDELPGFTLSIRELFPEAKP